MCIRLVLGCIKTESSGSSKSERNDLVQRGHSFGISSVSASTNLLSILSYISIVGEVTFLL